jgi:hypothetical protein
VTYLIALYIREIYYYYAHKRLGKESLMTSVAPPWRGVWLFALRNTKFAHHSFCQDSNISSNRYHIKPLCSAIIGIFTVCTWAKMSFPCIHSCKSKPPTTGYVGKGSFVNSQNMAAFLPDTCAALSVRCIAASCSSPPRSTPICFARSKGPVM